MSYSAGQRVLASQLNLGSVIPVAPTSTATAGTQTSGTTETRDDVLGAYQFTAVSGYRYQVFVTNLVGNGTAGGDVFEVRVRDSGSTSLPTSSSTLLAAAPWYCPAVGSGGREIIPVTGTFVPSSSGTHTLAVFAVRVAGTGAFTPVSPFGGSPRELYVVSIGSV